MPPDQISKQSWVTNLSLKQNLKKNSKICKIILAPGLVGLARMSNFVSDKPTISPSEIVKLFHRFLNIENVKIHIMFNELVVAKREFVKLFLRPFFLLANVFLGGGGGCNMQLHGCIPREAGSMQVLVCLAPSSQTIGSLLRPPGWQS